MGKVAELNSLLERGRDAIWTTGVILQDYATCGHVSYFISTPERAAEHSLILLTGFITRKKGANQSVMVLAPKILEVILMRYYHTLPTISALQGGQTEKCSAAGSARHPRQPSSST